jgi:hypothetical protein
MGRCSTLLLVSSGAWLASVTGLIGVALGGLVSLAVSRQQIREARKQRAEEVLQERYQLSIDRRFKAYSEFINLHRSVQYAVRLHYERSHDESSTKDVETHLESAYDSVAMVFLVTEAQRTYDACRGVLSVLRQVEYVVREGQRDSKDDAWPGLNTEMGRAMREFQNAARTELEVNGPEWQWVDNRRTPDRPA